MEEDITNPFWWTGRLNTSNRNLFKDHESPDLLEKAYNPFMCNRNFSMFAETLMYAQEMNMAPHLDKKLQAELFLNSLRPAKRFAKWPKKSKGDGDLAVVMEYFGYGVKKAQAALAILTPQQITDIKDQMVKGGDK